MFSFLSMIKMLAFSLLVVLLLQIRIDSQTIEESAMTWFRTSSLTTPLQTVADGGVKLVRTTAGKVSSLFQFNISEKMKNRPGQRDLQLKLERSQAYLKEKASKAKESWNELNESEDQVDK